ncbi:unnamed protein product, partial [Ectocarpus sp. 12 AP-2014]
MKAQFDRRCKPRNFEMGDSVWFELSNGKRLEAKISKFIGKALVELTDGVQTARRHINQIWKR